MPAVRDEVERRDTAFHEAGHVAAALLLGRSPTRATIVIDGGFVGGVHYDDEPAAPPCVTSYFSEAPEKRAYLEARIIGFLAGTAAHDQYNPSRVRDSGDEMDERYARDRISRWERTDEQRESLFEHYRERARDLIVRNWPLVELIAHALLEKETLNREDLLDLLARHRAI